MLPSGYERLLLGHAVAVARTDLAPSIRRALVKADGGRSTLHEYASHQPGGRPLVGRGTVYAVMLPESRVPVVVRHNQRGGLLRAIRGDRFLAPTRAPHELTMSLELRRHGVRTPEVLAYALYPPGGIVQRSDVVTREVQGSRDLAEVLLHGDGEGRAAALASAAELVAALARARARHHDLNAKNILLSAEGAFALDVDRVQLGGSARDSLDGNLARITRSLRKWRDEFGAKISEQQIADLDATARGAAARAA